MDRNWCLLLGNFRPKLQALNMKSRQSILIGLAVICLGGYAFRYATEDTMLSATNNIGEAIVKQDTHALWAYVPQDERQFYHLNEAKFAKYWNEMIEPSLKQFDGYQVSQASTNGIELSLTSSKPGWQQAKPGFMVSGQLGKYYVPFIVGFSAFDVAGLKAKDAGGRKYLRLQSFVDWFRDNRSHLERLGISKIRRDAAHDNGQTFEELDAYFKQGVAYNKTLVSVAFR